MWGNKHRGFLFWKRGFWLQLSEHKNLEVELFWVSGEYWNVFDVGTKWTRKCDHAGLHVQLELFRLFFVFSIYDSRHWDDEKETWCEGGEVPEISTDSESSKE